jgi:hypothetical protein
VASEAGDGRSLHARVDVVKPCDQKRVGPRGRRESSQRVDGGSAYSGGRIVEERLEPATRPFPRQLFQRHRGGLADVVVLVVEPTDCRVGTCAAVQPGEARRRIAHDADVETEQACRQDVALVHQAKDGAFDLVVVGYRGHFLEDYLLGSTADRVAHHAPCPVMIVR